MLHSKVGDSMWSSLDAGWTSAHETYAGRLRTGYRLFDDVSVGVEARVNGNALDKDARLAGRIHRLDLSIEHAHRDGGIRTRRNSLRQA